MQVLVLNASALNLGFLGCYGNAWVATPHLDRLAAESVVFDQHFAENLDHAAGFLSSPFLQKIEAASANSCTRVTVADGGTLGSIVKPTLNALKQLTRRSSGLCWVDLPSLYPPWTIDEEIFGQYITPASDEDEEVEGQPVEPRVDPPIGPFDANDLANWECLRGTYAAAVTRMDASLENYSDKLRDSDLLDKLTIVFTADRGLALGEHGIVGDCRPWLHDEVVHLPLIVRHPDEAEAGRRVFGLTQPADLAATLFEFIGLAELTENGRSLLAMMRGQAESVRDKCISRWALDEAEEWSLRTRDCALLVAVKQPSSWPPRPMQFYVKPEDRWEVNNVIQHHLDLAEELERTLRAAAV